MSEQAPAKPVPARSGPAAHPGGWRKQRPLRFYILPAAAIFVFIQAFSLLAPILLSLVLILLMSLAMNPLVTRIRLLTGKRAVSAGLLAGVFVLAFFVVSWAFFSPMRNTAGKVSQKLPTYWERFQRPILKLEKQAGLAEEKLRAEIASEAKQKAVLANDGVDPEKAVAEQNREPAAPKNTEPPSFIRTGLAQMLQGAASRFTALAFNAAQIIVVLITVFFGVTFTLMNPRPVFGAILATVPEMHHAKAVAILQRVGKFMPKWALATLLAMVMVGTLVFLVMWPLFGFVDALVLGLIAGMLEAIPYLGPILSAVPAMMFALGEGGSAPLWVVGCYLGIQFLENNLIAPLVMAGGMKLHPLAVMISMLLCVAAFGVLGVIVAAPMVAVIQILHDELYRKRFLPGTTDSDLERMTRAILHERLDVK